MAWGPGSSKGTGSSGWAEDPTDFRPVRKAAAAAVGSWRGPGPPPGPAASILLGVVRTQLTY